MPANLLKIYGTVVCLYSVEGFVVTVFGPYLESQGLDYGTVGSIIAIFFFMSLLSRVPAGMLYRPKTVRLTMAVSLVFVSAAMFLYPHTSDPYLLTLLRVVQGLSFGVATTLNMAMFFQLRPRDFARGRAMGIFAASLAVGKMIGRFVSGIVADHWGYTVSFGLSAIFPLLAILLTFLLVFDDPLDEPEAQSQMKSKTAGASQGSWREKWSSGLQSLRHLGDPLILIPTMMAFSLNFLHTMFDNFFPILGLAIGLSLSTVGLYGGLNNFIGVFSRLMTGELGRIFLPAQMTHFGLLLSVVLLFFLPSAHNPYVLLALVMGLAVGRAIITVTSAVEVMKVGKGREGIASGIFNSGKDLGSIAGPAMAGWISDVFGLAEMFRWLPIGLLIFYTFAMLGIHVAMRNRQTRVDQTA